MRPLPEPVSLLRLLSVGTIGGLLLFGSPAAGMSRQPAAADRVGPDCAPVAAVHQGPRPALDRGVALTGPGLPQHVARDADQLTPAQVVQLERMLQDTLLNRGLLASGEGQDGLPPARRPLRKVPTSITVPVYVHVIHDGADGKLTADTVKRQIAHLNEAYGAHEANGTDQAKRAAAAPFRFVLQRVDYTDDSVWFGQTRPGTLNERTMKKRLRKGGANALNLYTLDTGTETLGWSTYPQHYKARPGYDGVVLAHDSLPDAGRRGYDQGDTGSHEIGHWLGLYHTFLNGCAEPGDYVDDTPAERSATSGCPVEKNSCALPGEDPVHNYMDYGSDLCMNHFTPGQVDRMVRSWQAYRQ